MSDAQLCASCGRAADALYGRCLGCAFASEEPELPTSVGPYPVLDLVGSGGMGLVYRGRQACPLREVAIKTMKDPLPDPAMRRRFLAEREIAGRFEHPNIIRVYDAGEDEDSGPYYVMEHAPRGTLASFIERTQLVPVAAIRLVIDVALAVQHAHECGVLHRDLKPANILLDADLRPRVTDFGVAKLSTDAGLSPLGSTVVGAWPYMSPEQAAYPGGSQAVSERTDVYGLGAILFELLEGQPPNAATSERALHAWFGSEAETLRVPAAEVMSLELEAVCLKALALDPGCRYPSAAALADDLRAVLGNRKTVATPRSPWRRLRTFAARHERLLLILISALLSLGIAASLIDPLLQRQDIARDRESTQRVDEQAITVEHFFRSMGSTARQVAEDPVTPQILARGSITNPAPEFERYRKENRLVSSILLFTREGRPLARLPAEAPDYFETQFAGREYLHNASNAALQGLDTAAYVSATFYSWRHGLLKIAFSVPIVDPKTRELRGIAVATLEVSQLAPYFTDENIVLSAPQELQTSPGAAGPVQGERHVARIGFGQGRPRSIGPVLTGAAKGSSAAGKTLYRREIGQSGYAVETEISGTELHAVTWAVAVWVTASVLLFALGCLRITNSLRTRAALARVRARGAPSQ
jgi:eukaryotic-like serine/threonine-protein kinase